MVDFSKEIKGYVRPPASLEASLMVHEEYT